MNKIKFLFDIPRFREKNYPLPLFFSQKEANKWHSIHTGDFIQLMDEYSLKLLDLGVRPKDKIAIMSTGNIEWNLLDLACQQIGAIVVPIFPNMITSDYHFILEHSESRFCFVEHEHLLQAIHPLTETISTLEKVYHLKAWSLSANGEANTSRILNIKDTLQESDVASIIYTSGTGGNPKGVILTHRNIVTSVLGGAERIPGFAGCRVLSFLPISHIYERMMIYLYMYMGFSVYYAESLLKIADNIKEVKPHLFSAVPRFIEKVYEKFITTGNQLNGVKRKIFFWSIGVAEQYEVGNSNLYYRFKLFFARKLVLSKFKEALGGEIISISSASATLSIKIARIFFAAGIPVIEGYGLTETSPTISVSHSNGGIKLGTTGPILSNITLKITEEGEILVKGEAVMKGYYKLPKLTKEVFTTDGWFRTGDLGEIVDGKFLKILGRKNNSFKLSNGKFIIPQKLEALLSNSVFIEYALVMGENEKYPSVLIFPAIEYLKDWLKIDSTNTPSTVLEITKNEDVLSEIKKIIESLNKKLNSWERIKKFELLPIIPTIENGLLTPTFKLKRKEVVKWWQKMDNHK